MRSNMHYEARKISIDNLLNFQEEGYPMEDNPLLFSTSPILPEEAYLSWPKYRHYTHLYYYYILGKDVIVAMRNRKEIEEYRMLLNRWSIYKAVRKGVSRQWETPSPEIIEKYLTLGRKVKREIIKKSLSVFQADRLAKLKLLKLYWQTRHK